MSAATTHHRSSVGAVTAHRLPVRLLPSGWELPSWARPAGFLVAGLAGFAAGVLPATGATGLVAAAPLALVVLLVGAAILITRFEFAVLALVAVRPTLDAFGGADLESSGQLNIVAALAMFGLAGVYVLTQGISVPDWGRPMIFGIAVLLVAAAVATPGSGGVGLRLLLRLVGGMVPFGLFLMMIHRRHTTSTRLFLTALIATTPALVVGLWQLATGVGHPGFTEQRIYGTLTHPNVLGAVVAVVGAAAVVVIMAAYGRRIRIAAGAWIVLAVPVLVGTYTRGAWIAFAVACLLGALLVRPILLAAVPVLVLVVAFAVPSVLDRVADATQNTEIGDVESSSLAWRLSYWQEAIELTGNGRQIEGLGLDGIRQESTDANVPHNEFIRFGVEAGIFGLFAFLIFVGGVGRSVVLAARSVPRGHPSRALASIGIVALVAAVVFASNGNLMSQVTIMWPAAAVIVASLGAAIEYRSTVERSRAGTVSTSMTSTSGPIA